MMSFMREFFAEEIEEDLKKLDEYSRYEIPEEMRSGLVGSRVQTRPRTDFEEDDDFDEDETNDDDDDLDEDDDEFLKYDDDLDVEIDSLGNKEKKLDSDFEFDDEIDDELGYGLVDDYYFDSDDD
jgi:hypothetical protein